jgi:hypothetical protein
MARDTYNLMDIDVSDVTCMEATDDTMFPEPSVEQQLHSQNGLSSFASLVIAGLPFPPLPIMVRRGEDMEEGIGSSFDLFHQAIIGMSLAGKHASKSNAELAAAKSGQLSRLHTFMSCHYTQHLQQHTAWDNSAGTATTPRFDGAWLDQAYTIYCTAFREYLLEHYAVASHDLRFLPMDAVAADSVLMQHAHSHVRGSFMISSGQSVDDAPTFQRYSDVIQHYAVDLGTLPAC